MVGAQGRGPTGSSVGSANTGGKIAGYQQGQMQQFTPEQMDLFKQLFSHVSPGSGLSKLAGGDQSQFEQMEEPALKQFGQLQSGIASRFSGAGLGGRHSSGFQQAQTSAAQDFAGQLASRRQSLQREALGDLFGLSSHLMGQRPYEQYLLPEQKSFGQELGISLAGGLGQGLGSLPGILSGINWGKQKQ